MLFVPFTEKKIDMNQEGLASSVSSSVDETNSSFQRLLKNLRIEWPH